MRLHFPRAYEELIRKYESLLLRAAFVPPEGTFYLLKEGDNAVGMGGLRKVRKGIGEIKRMYLKPECKGKGLARRCSNSSGERTGVRILLNPAGDREVPYRSTEAIPIGWVRGKA